MKSSEEEEGAKNLPYFKIKQFSFWDTVKLFLQD